MATITPLQAQCLGIIKRLAPAWIKPSYVFAHIKIESGWDPDILAADYATTGSVGLMQVTRATAKEVGVPYNQSIPYNSILAGLRYIKQCQQYLSKHGVSVEHYAPAIVQSYNVGVGGYVKGRRNARYLQKWAEAQNKYAFVDKLES